LRISRSSPAVAASLDQHVEHLALMIDSTPKVHPLPADPLHHLVQVPTIAWPRTVPA
jgi:hypothetical protein